ncbi:phosphatidate cytidylyltransferase [Blochmannia endosymbiont of Camponotus (Colobopsis) obliquus]|uniref:phosphatidate cytidylyltransferase n=1 Tax=Blochmannia endosymbiont of Camponotus (Colobopsis) obliquus TaxID=1505597 RepID=UPI00061A68D3|nr:phosphatidate cytidylyltransferase [Blochmannia endosymbiont of Camponotus (Colobopsis) obliquus]AKC60443.1 phosphatidate cytidylyltransferase [Blochmannia endosymbiont of Camponotus (Colobopsis) obliquus]
MSLKYRLITSFILIFIVIGILFFSSIVVFEFVSFAVCSLCFWEWGLLAGLKFIRQKIYWMIVCELLLLYVMLLFLFHRCFVVLLLFKYIIWIFLIWWIIVLFLIFFYSTSVIFLRNSSIMRLLFGILTVMPFFISTLILRQYNYDIDPYIGSWWLLYFMVLIWSVDSGAYIFGSVFGCHKLAPKISFNKTWEGVFGGLLTCIIFGVIFYNYTPINISPCILLICSTITVIFSILGDLFESMLKRTANVKDSGNIIPGHGGVLDRMDSLTAALPVFVYLILYFFNVI